MKIKLTKPRDGFTTVTLDDRRGITGMRLRLGKVAVEDVEAVVSEAVKAWETKRGALIAARS